MRKQANFYIFILLLLLFSVALGSYLLRGRQTLQSSAAPNTSLSFNLPISSIRTNDTFTVEIKISTGTNSVIGGDFEISYDRTKLQALSVSPGPFLPNASVPAGTTNLGTTTGLLQFSLLQAVPNPPQQGTGTLATVQFKAIAVGSSSLTYTANTIVAAINENSQNVVTTKTPLTVVVANPTNTPTPSPSPSPTLTPTKTPTPTMSPTPTPTPIVTVSPTPGITPISQVFSARLGDEDGTGSGATGTAQLTFTGGTTATLTMSFTGLTSAETMAHIHGPAPVGQSAGIQVTLPTGQVTSQTINLTSAQIQMLNQGQLYINIHTTNFPNGEIRGQLTAGTLSATPTKTPTVTPTTTTFIQGDIDRNGSVNLLDYVLLFENFGRSTAEAGVDVRADINNSGTINLLDYVLLFEHFGQHS